MIGKRFDDIVASDVKALIQDGVIEVKTLEYKQQLPGNTDADKKEFLADISSFANASGGDVLYGIKAEVDAGGEPTGAPGSIAPISNENADKAKLRIEEIIRNGIEPRLPVEVKPIDGWDQEGFVLLIRVPQSFASPHVVKYRNASRFYGRNSAGKYQLDVHELKSAFLATDSQADRIRQFRQERVSRIIADEAPVTLSSRNRLVLHVIPLRSFLNNSRIDLTTGQAPTREFPPLGAGGWDHRYNLDGFLTWNPSQGQSPSTTAYCQVFFNGTVEAVCAGFVRNGQRQRTEDAPGFIGSIAYERDIMSAITSYLKGLKMLELSPPFAVSLALLGCKGARLFVDPLFAPFENHPIDRDMVLPPGVIMDKWEDVSQQLRPIFDAVWNACGYPRSMNYDETGAWNPRP